MRRLDMKARHTGKPQHKGRDRHSEVRLVEPDRLAEGQKEKRHRQKPGTSCGSSHPSKPMGFLEAAGPPGLPLNELLEEHEGAV